MSAHPGWVLRKNASLGMWGCRSMLRAAGSGDVPSTGGLSQGWSFFHAWRMQRHVKTSSGCVVTHRQLYRYIISGVGLGGWGVFSGLLARCCQGLQGCRCR